MGIKDDVAALCAGAPDAVDVSWGAESSRGPYEEFDAMEPDGGGFVATQRRIELRVPAHHLDGIARDDVVAIERDEETESYRVREVLLAEDGREKDLILVRV